MPARLGQHPEECPHLQHGRDEAEEQPCAQQHRPPDDALTAGPWRPDHESWPGPFPAQGQRREGFGPDIEGEQLEHGSGSGTAPRASANTRNGTISGIEWARCRGRTSGCCHRSAGRPGSPPRSWRSCHRSSTMVAASLATSVLDLPIAISMSALRSAGASFTPSPVIATMCPSARSASAMRSLARAKIGSSPERSNRSPSSTSRMCRRGPGPQPRW